MLLRNSKIILLSADFYKFDKYETSHIFTIKHIIIKWHARQNFIVNTSLFTSISSFFCIGKN